MPRKILHFHLPKTGGTALRYFFVDQLGEEQVSLPISGMKLRDALLQWSHCQAISGHFAVIQGDTIPTDRYSITVLRDPVDRFLSEYFFRKHNNANRLLDISLQSTDSEIHLARYTDTGSDYLMVQLGMLFPLGAAPCASISTEDKLRAAQLAIDRFDAIGLQEELEDFAHMLCAEFSWHYQPLARVNTTSQRISIESLPAAQRKAIHDLLEPEIALYDYARTRFRIDRRRYIRPTASGGIDQMQPGNMTAELSDPTVAADQEVENIPLDFGDKRCELLSAEVVGTISGPGRALAGEHMRIIVRFVAHEAVEQLNIGIAVKDERGVLAYGTNSLLLGNNFALSPGRYEAAFKLFNRLGCGYYQLDAALVQTSSHFDGCYHWRERMARLEVPGSAVSHFDGRVLMDATVVMEGLTIDAAWQRDKVIAPRAVIGAFGRMHPAVNDFRAATESIVAMRMASIGSDLVLQVRVCNRGADTWPSTGRNPISLSYRWLLPDGGIEVADGLRTALPADLAPGEETIVPLHVQPPTRTGSFVLAVSLIQEQNAWFIDRDASSGFSLQVEVTA